MLGWYVRKDHIPPYGGVWEILYDGIDGTFLSGIRSIKVLWGLPPAENQTGFDSWSIFASIEEAAQVLLGWVDEKIGRESLVGLPAKSGPSPRIMEISREVDRLNAHISELQKAIRQC